jgi:acyl dehydratase
VATGSDAVGKTWPAGEYEVGREKIREYAEAIGEDNEIYLDRDRARAAGFRDVVAPPMFAVVYTARPVGTAIADPDVGLDYSRMVHAGQEFVWGEPVCEGDVVSTETSLQDVSEKGKNVIYTFGSTSKNQDDQEVVSATWTLIVRGES